MLFFFEIFLLFDRKRPIADSRSPRKELCDKFEAKTALSVESLAGVQERARHSTHRGTAARGAWGFNGGLERSGKYFSILKTSKLCFLFLTEVIQSFPVIYFLFFVFHFEKKL